MKSHFRLIAAFALVAVLGACSDRKPPTDSSSWLPDSGEVVRASSQAGGMASSYAAYFDGDHLRRITETRKTSAGEAQGEYEFTEARLTYYKGTALQSDVSVEFRFDLHGALTSATPGADEQTISAIRNRAELLRSLVLARRSTDQHAVR